MPKDAFDKNTDTEQTVLFKTKDGAELVGQLYLPSHPAFAIVVLNGATGVPQRFYRHFARWLAKDRGLACLTYDYRDSGRSISGRLNKSQATMSDWAIADAEAARRAARKFAPDTPIWIVGHSLGAMLIPAQENVDDISRIVGVASGLVHLSDHPWSYRWLAWLFWYGLGPAATWITGYMPGRILRFGEDLPSGVYWQWRRWCTTRGFFRSELGHIMPAYEPDRIQAPTYLFSLSDDQMIPPKCVQALADLYGNAKHVPLKPSNYDLKKVGHLGMFAPANAALWPELLGQ